MLKESVAGQKSFESLADTIIRLYSKIAARNLTKKFNQSGGEYTPEVKDFGVITFDHVVKLMTLDDMQGLGKNGFFAFVKRNPTLALCYLSGDGLTNGQYVQTTSRNAILIYIPALPKMIEGLLDDLQTGGNVEKTINTLIGTSKDVLIHELVHAYDDWASSGKFSQNKRTQNAREVMAKTGDDFTDENSFRTYLNDPVEISARFTQSVYNIRYFKHEAWVDYLDIFQKYFQGWDALRKKDKIRLTKRLAAIWTDSRRKELADITRPTWKIEDELTDDFGVIPIWSVGRHIEMEGFERPVDGDVLDDVLAKIVAFADRVGRVISIESGVFPPDDLTRHGFVLNRGDKANTKYKGAFYRIPYIDQLREKLR